jgi:hypothetical protein
LAALAKFSAFEAKRVWKKGHQQNLRRKSWRSARNFERRLTKNTLSTQLPLKCSSQILAVQLIEEKEQKTVEIEIDLREVGFEISISTLTANHFVNFVKYIAQPDRLCLLPIGISRKTEPKSRKPCAAYR